MVNTKKFSQFAAANLTTTTKKMAGISNSAGGENIIVDFTVEWTTSTRPSPPYDGLLGYNTDLKQYEYYDLTSLSWVQLADNAVFVNAKFIVQQPNASLPAAQALSALSTGILKSTTTSGVLSISAPLTSIDGLTTAADEMIYTTGSNVYATTALTAFARTFLADASASAMRSTLGLGQAAVKNVTDNSKANVASVTGGFVIGHVLLAADASGTVKDGGSPAGMGTVLEVDTGTGLTGGPITTTGTISFADIAANSLWVNNTGGIAVPTVTSLAALTKIDDANVTLTLGGTPSTALINAVSLTLGWTGQLSLARGGTNANLTPSNGGIVYSTATALAILSGTATASLPLLSGSSAAPSWGAFALSLGGALTTAGALTTVGAFGVTFTFTNTTSVTFPTSGTLATTSGSLVTITGDSGTATVSSGNINIVGGSTGLTTSGASATLTLGGLLNSTYGGTGVSIPTAHGIMVAEGASAMTPIVLGAGQVLIGTTASDPVAGAIGSGSGILVGNSSGSISVSLAAIADHTLLANISGGALAPSSTTLTALIDNAIGSTQGDILYRNATSWVVLAPSTSGFVLTTGGAAANPSWAAAPGGTPAALTKTDDTNVTLTLGGSPSTALLQATSLTLGWTGQLGLTRGGTAASLTASNGGIVYSTASALAILAGTATAGLALLSGASTTPTWSTSPPITQVNVQKITATGAFTYTPTTGTKYAIFELQGGGGGSGAGGGAASQGSCPAGGGGGAYQKILVTGAANLAAITGSVGVGGTAGAVASGNGGTGGNTTLVINSGSTWTAGGGPGGPGQAASASAQVSSTQSGGTNSSGTNGTLMDATGGGWNFPGFISAAANTVPSASSVGGGSRLGGTVNAGAAGLLYGGGATTAPNGTGSNQPGFAGGQGIVIVTEYISV